MNCGWTNINPDPADVRCRAVGPDPADVRIVPLVWFCNPDPLSITSVSNQRMFVLCRWPDPTWPSGCSASVGLDLQSRPIEYKDFQSAKAMNWTKIARVAINFNSQLSICNVEDLEITSLLTADPASAPKLNTLGYDSDGNAAQVRLAVSKNQKTIQ